MPVTIKLSRRFYQQSGDEPANELVDVLNNMDATYRAELRDLIELAFEKFESRLDARVERVASDLRVEMRDMKVDLIRWMFLFWTGTALANVLLK